MKLGKENFVGWFNSRATLDMKSEDGMSTWWRSIQVVLANRATQLTLKQAVQCFLFTITNGLSQAFNGNTTSLIICDLQVLNSSNITTRLIRKQISNLFVVNLCITDSNSDCLIKFVARQSVQLRDRTGHDTTVLKLSGAASHWISLTSTSLSIAQDCTIEAFNDRLDDFRGTHFVSFILAGIV